MRLIKHFIIYSALLISISTFAATTTGSSKNQDESWADDWGDDPWAEQSASPWSNLVMFGELSLGRRLKSDPVISTDTTLNEARFQVQADYALSSSLFKVRAHTFYDGVQDKWRGQIRELNWQGKVSDKWDVKVGQQILTWGTGDYLFVNDMFAKDWQSFFAGRDDEYLKAPHFAVKASGYFEFASIDLVLTPKFTPDHYINGDVFSFYNPMAAKLNGNQNIAPEFEVADENSPDGPEIAIRIKKQVSGIEWALYGYDGYQKSPESLTPSLSPTFTELSVLGASVVMPVASGLFNVELAQHLSEDSEGEDPLIPNSEFKLLLGYQTELVANLTGSIQFQLERLKDQDPLQAKDRTLLTTQLHYRFLQDKASVQWFTFYSPSDADGFSRIRASYKPFASWEFSAGANVFWGKDPDSFFGQFENASNSYLRVRHYF